ncbi:glycosyltransferase family 2 protein [Candidatus Bathyarchaeota archaeon]|nr:glycosyltransferase family 2 protein [Candidatus Bathyarchaeota archaeon]
MFTFASRTPLVSIVVANYNNRNLLARCLDSITELVYQNFEVIVVDDASTDDSIRYVREHYKNFSRLKIAENSQNLGYAESNNIGARIAGGDYVFLLNNDTEVTPTSVSRLVEVMESDPSIGVCQSKLLNMEDRNRVDSIGGFLDYLGNSVNRQPWGAKDREAMAPIFFAKGAALMIRRDLTKEIGLFDEKFRAYYEDVDLCWRVWLRGYRVIVVPGSVVYHAESSVLRRMPAFSSYHMSKNRLATLIRNYGRGNLLKYVPLAVALTLGAILFLTFRMSSRAHPLLMSLIWNLRNLSHNWKWRILVQNYVRRTPDSVIIMNMKKPDIAKLMNFLKGGSFP